jgi:hypothetical protein
MSGQIWHFYHSNRFFYVHFVIQSRVIPTSDRITFTLLHSRSDFGSERFIIWQRAVVLFRVPGLAADRQGSGVLRADPCPSCAAPFAPAGVFTFWSLRHANAHRQRN